MAYELLGLTMAIDEPDGAVGHAVGIQVAITGKGRHLTRYGHLFSFYDALFTDYVHPSAVVEQQWLVVAGTSTADAEVERACADDFIRRDVVDGNAVLANDEQLTFVVHALQTEGLVDMLYEHHPRVVAFDDHQMPRMTDGIVSAVFRCVAIAETVGLVV